MLLFRPLGILVRNVQKQGKSSFSLIESATVSSYKQEREIGSLFLQPVPNYSNLQRGIYVKVEVV